MASDWAFGWNRSSSRARRTSQWRRLQRLATLHAFGDAWPRDGVLDVRTRALVSVAIARTLGTIEPLGGPIARRLE
jgi:alkylhydroperoxidase/carboxymuconolactone decarboxylase family protein YurZ